MVNALSFNDAIAVTLSAQKVLRTATSHASIKRFQLDEQLTPSPFAEVRIVLSESDTKTALSIAIRSGNGIIGALRALKSSARLAQHESLVSQLTELSIVKTRISRLNLDVDTNRALSLIDGLVARSKIANANFISSASPNLRIKTTRFGGALDVMPQPLVSVGLNLRNISLLTTANAEDAEVRLKAAINTATRRMQGLETLQRVISSGNFLSQNLTSLVHQNSGVGLPAGTLVNVIG